MHEVLEIVIIIGYILYFLLYHIAAIAIFVRASLKKWKWGLFEWSWFFYFIETPIFLIFLPMAQDIDNVFLKFIIIPIIIIPGFIWMITIPYHYNMRNANTVKTSTKILFVATIILYFISVLLFTGVLPESSQASVEVIRYFVVISIFFLASQEVKKSSSELYEQQKRLEYNALILISLGFFLFTIGFIIVAFTDIPLNFADITEHTILTNIMILAFSFSLIVFPRGFYLLLKLTWKHSDYKPYQVYAVPNET